MGSYTVGALVGIIVLILWNIIIIIQGFLAYGTAYRKAKEKGDNGLSLFGWLIVYALAGIIPYLGIYFWKKSRS